MHNPRIGDPDGLGLIDYHASGDRPSHDGGPRMAALTIVPPWDGSTQDGYDIYAGNWPCDGLVVPPLLVGAHKSSEGAGTYDAKFGEWVRTVAGRHKYRGAYHVIWPWRAGKADNYIEQQAEDFYNFTRAMGVDWTQPGWFVQIDNEQFSGMPRIANEDEVRRFADWLIARIGNRIAHYCNPVTDPTIFFSTKLADLPKWEAQYNRNASRAPTVIRQWGGWPVNGIWNNRAVDANYIEKHDVLDDITGYSPTPIPPAEGATPMGQHIGWIQLTDDAGNVLANTFGELMMNYDTTLARTSTVGDGIGVFGFPLGRASQSSYNALPPYNPDADIAWFFLHQPAPNLSPITSMLATITTMITTVQQQITSLQTVTSSGFTTTNQNVGIVGAAVAGLRTVVDQIKAQVDIIRPQVDVTKTTTDTIKGTTDATLAAINALPGGGGGGGDCDLQPVLDAIAALETELHGLEVAVTITETTHTVGKVQ